jgi:peptide/nickel transport system permease protein
LRAGALLLFLLGLAALLGPLVVQNAPLAQDRTHLNQPPGLSRPGGASRHVLGTDSLGRDVLSRTLSGARFTLLTALAGVVVTVGLGTVLGIAAGLLGGLWDRLILRTSELFMTLPALYLVLALRNLFRDALDPLESGAIILVSLTAVGWTGVARLVRGQVVSIRETDYVAAARAAGATRLRVMAVHVLPALGPFLLLQLGISFPYFLLGEVTLSFLGLGLSEPAPSLGNLLAASVAGAGLLSRHWWIWLAPASVLTLAVLGTNLVLEGVRERYGLDSGPPERSARVSWATTMSRFLSSSPWGSKHLRQRAS